MQTRDGRGSPRYSARMGGFSAVKVFSTTMAREREQLGERITTWLLGHPELRVVDRVVTQTSDNEYHCLSVTLFLAGPVEKYLSETPTAVPRPAPRPAPRRFSDE